MSGFISKDIRTIVLKSVHPSLLDFHFPFGWYFLKEFHSYSVRIVSKIMKGIFIGFKSLNPVIFNRLKKEKHHIRYNGTLYSLALIDLLHYIWHNLYYLKFDFFIPTLYLAFLLLFFISVQVQKILAYFFSINKHYRFYLLYFLFFSPKYTRPFCYTFVF